MTNPPVTERGLFNAIQAPALAGQLGFAKRVESTSYSGRFAYFEDANRFLVVAGPQEKSDVQRALPLGLQYASGRQMSMILPRSHSNATLQRTPWLNTESRPTVYLFDDAGTLSAAVERTREETIDQVLIGPGKGNPAKELRDATRSHHLGSKTAVVAPLVEWAMADRRLDPSHRRGYRSWSYRGKRVLSLWNSGEGIKIIAGIHYSTGAATAQVENLPSGAALTDDFLSALVRRVESGIAERNSENPKLAKADEHWLQAVIRRDPHLVGVEQPALREVPAWRPADLPGSGTIGPWGRGFIDLLGLDAHGDVRIVETKIESNRDELLVLQGLDYYVWAKAYRTPIVERLGAADEPRLKIHYVIGAAPGGIGDVHPATTILLDALGADIIREIQVLTSWYSPA